MRKSYIFVYVPRYLLVAACLRVALGGWPQILTQPIIQRIKKDNFLYFLIAKKLHTLIFFVVLTDRCMLKGSFKGLTPNYHPAYNSKNKKDNFSWFLIAKKLHIFICFAVFIGRCMLKGGFRGLTRNSHSAYNSKNKKR